MSDKHERGNYPTDDGRPWGWICEGEWRAMPKIPMLLAGMGPPPFDVVLPTGLIRHVLHKPLPSIPPVVVEDTTD